MELLKKHNACEQAQDWAQGKTIEEAYNTCPRGDWMLWLFAKTNPEDFQRLTLAKGHCANTVRHLMKDERSINAVDVAIAFGEGNATREELDAYAAAAASYAAAYASYAAASYAAAYASYAAAAAADDYANAAAYAAAAYAAYAARKENQLQTADICRKYLPLEIWNVK